MNSSDNFIDSQRVRQGVEDIQGHSETHDEKSYGLFAAATHPAAEADPVRKTERISLISGAREEDMGDTSVSSSNELRLKSGLYAVEAGLLRKRRPSGADEQATPETRSTSRLNERERVVKAMPVRRTPSAAASVAESLTVSSKENRAATYGAGGSEARGAGPSRERRPDDESDAEEVHEGPADTPTGDGPLPVQLHELSPYLTYHQRRSKERQTTVPGEPGSTTFKKRRVEGPTQIDFLEELSAKLKSEPNPTENTHRMIEMVEARLARYKARQAARAARLAEHEEALGEFTEGTSSYTSAPDDDFSAAMEAGFDMASVHPDAAAFTLRATREPSAYDLTTDDEVIVYPVGQEDRSTVDPSNESEGGQVPDSELEYESSLGGESPSRSSDVVMDLNDPRTSAPAASPISVPASAAAPAISTATPEVRLSTTSSVVAQMRSRVAFVKKIGHKSASPIARSQKVHAVKGNRKRNDVGAVRTRLGVGLDDETPMMVDPGPVPASRPRSTPRALTAPVDSQSTAKDTASDPSPPVGKPESRPSPMSSAFRMPQQKKPVSEVERSAGGDDTPPPLPTPRARYKSASPTGSMYASSTPRAHSYRGQAGLSSHADDSCQSSPSPTPRAHRFKGKATQRFPDADHVASQKGASPPSSPTPLGRERRSKTEYERPASPTPSRQSLHTLLSHGHASSDDHYSTSSVEPPSSFSGDGNRTPPARGARMTPSPNSREESVALPTTLEPSRGKQGAHGGQAATAGSVASAASIAPVAPVAPATSTTALPVTQMDGGAPAASPISVPASAAAPATSTATPAESSSTTSAVVAQTKSGIAIVKKDRHESASQISRSQKVHGATSDRKRNDVGAVRTRLGVGLDDETPMMVDPGPVPASRPRSTPRALTAPVDSQSTAKDTASDPSPPVGKPESRPSPMSSAFRMPQQKKPVSEVERSAGGDDTPPPLPTPRARYKSASPTGSMYASSTPRAHSYRGQAGLSSHADDSCQSSPSPTPRAHRFKGKATQRFPDADHVASQKGASPPSSPTPLGRERRSKTEYERPASPTPSRQSLHTLLSHGHASSDDHYSTSSVEPPSSFSGDGNRTPPARGAMMTPSPNSREESVALSFEPLNSDDEAAALLTKIGSPSSEEEASILGISISPGLEGPPRHDSPNPFDDVPGPRPMPAWLPPKRPSVTFDSRSISAKRKSDGGSAPQGTHSTSQTSRSAPSSRGKQVAHGGQAATAESTSRQGTSSSRAAAEGTGAHGGQAATAGSTSRQGSSSSRAAAEGTEAHGGQAATVGSTSQQGTSSSRAAAEGTGAQGGPTVNVTSSSSSGPTTQRQLPADRGDDYASKADMDLLKVAVQGLSTEVRAITSYLKQGGQNASNGDGESLSDGAAAGPPRAKPSSSQAKPSSSKTKSSSSKARSTSKGAPSRTNSKDYASDNDEEYSGDSEEVERLKQPIRHRSPDHNQLSLDVQSHAMMLLGRANRHSPFPAQAIATPAQVRGFDPDEGECCTAKQFCIDIRGTPASVWNASATRVFVKSFMTVAQFKCRNRKKIHDMFKSYFKTLKRHYDLVGQEKNEGDEDADTVDASETEGEPSTSKRKQEKPSSSNPNDAWFKGSSTGKGKAKATTASTEADAKAHSRYQRKYIHWDRRYKILCRYRVLRHHAWILQKLGVDGMSSDEEEEGAPIRRYRVFVKPWRSQVVTDFLRVLDALHRRYRQRAGAGTKRGSAPRLRYLSLDKSTSDAVERLPINAYDAVWYGKLQGLKKDDIAAKASYDFTIDQSVLDAVANCGPVQLGGLTYV